MQATKKALFFIGLSKVSVELYYLNFSLYNWLFKRQQSDNLKVFGAGLNTEWALVTGASEGIGAEYARQLAHKGYNIALLSRSVDNLNKVA